MDPNPVVMLIVRLLAATPVTNDGIPLAHRASAHDNLVRPFRPVGGKLVQRHGDWDKENNRCRKGAPHAEVDRSRSQPAAKRLLLKENPTERE
jgi:hypothetical protein